MAASTMSASDAPAGSSATTAASRMTSRRWHSADSSFRSDEISTIVTPSRARASISVGRSLRARRRRRRASARRRSAGVGAAEQRAAEQHLLLVAAAQLAHRRASDAATSRSRRSTGCAERALFATIDDAEPRQAGRAPRRWRCSAPAGRRTGRRACGPRSGRRCRARSPRRAMRTANGRSPIAVVDRRRRARARRAGAPAASGPRRPARRARRSRRRVSCIARRHRRAAAARSRSTRARGARHDGSAPARRPSCPTMWRTSSSRVSPAMPARQHRAAVAQHA